MTEDTMDSNESRSLRRTAPCSAALVAMATLVAACSSPSGASDGATRDGSVLREPFEILDTSVEVVDGVVTSACFTFEMPAIAEYEINPYSENCQTAIRWAGGDSLSEITVRSSTGDSGIDDFFQLMDKNATASGVTITSTDVVSLPSGEAGVAYFDDAFGLASAIFFIPETTGTFLADGEPLASFMIGGLVGAPEMEDALNQVVTSFEILND